MPQDLIGIARPRHADDPLVSIVKMHTLRDLREYPTLTWYYRRNVHKENVLLQRRYSHWVDKTTGVPSDQTVILTANGASNTCGSRHSLARARTQMTPAQIEKPAARVSSIFLTTFDVVMESGSGVRFHAIPRGPEATGAMEAGKARTQLPLAETMLGQAAEADRVEPGDKGSYIEALNLGEFSGPQPVIAARSGPMIGTTERNRREVRGFLPQASGAGMRGFNVAAGFAHRAGE